MLKNAYCITFYCSNNKVKHQLIRLLEVCFITAFFKIKLFIKYIFKSLSMEKGSLNDTKNSMPLTSQILFDFWLKLFKCLKTKSSLN